ncbi:hypothetical protein [Motiliproteus sediminis]|uniref:hypothetical protein n=1 Tax=Motiliproteus sediminis TaxID=1468178 RepID=UPI001AEFB9ED|nr:hypothetical protein [Motiliproteus sediminis]
MSKQQILRGWLAVLVLLLAGCSASPRMPKGELVGPFILSAAEVEQVIVAAVRQGWPEAELKRVNGEPLSYQFTVWRLADADTLRVEAAPDQQGRYAIRVANLRYSSELSDPTREKLVGLIVKEARRRSDQPGG